MKAEIDVKVFCPVCGLVMIRFDSFISCKNEPCGLFDVKFEKPTITLKTIFPKFGDK